MTEQLEDVPGRFVVNRIVRSRLTCAVDANWLRDMLGAAGIRAVIPVRSNRRFPAELDCNTHKWRHLIENFFEKLNEYRGIAMRCCETAESYGALAALAATVVRPKRTSSGPG